MTPTVKNIVILAWRVEDGEYLYQGQFEYTLDEFAAINWEEVKVQQLEEFTKWRDAFVAMKAQQ